MNASSISVRGRLVDDLDEIIPNRKVQVYNGNHTFLAYVKTDSQGKFKFEFKEPQWKKIDLTFRLCEEKKCSELCPPLKDKDSLLSNLKFIRERKEAAEASIKILSSSSRINIGDLAFKQTFEKESVPLSYYLHLGTAAFESVMAGAHRKVAEKFNLIDALGPQDIMDIYEVPSVDLTVENTWKFITNGICPLYFKKKDGFLVGETNFDKYEFDKLKSLPNVALYFKEKGMDLLPDLEKIEISFRETLEPSSNPADKLTEVYGKKELENGLRRLNSLRKANSSFHVFGQVKFHLGVAHIYAGSVAEAAHDYLQGTKIGELILPHCLFTQTINTLGKVAIFGDPGILNKSALSVEGIAQMISDTVAGIDPFTWAPREPLNIFHDFAKVQKLHYGLILEGVLEFIQNHWDQIISEWKNIHLFFKRLHKNSPVFIPYDGIEPDREVWQDVNEIGGNVSSRVPERCSYKDEGLKSLRPVAVNKNGPDENDKDNLTAFFAHFIFISTFHSWIHRSQYAAQVSSDARAPHVSDVNFSPITMENYGNGPFGCMTAEDVKEQVSLLDVFKNFPTRKYALIDNEKVQPCIKNRIKAAAKEYKKYGISVKEITASVNI